MRQCLALFLLTASGLMSGYTASLLILAFNPACGYDCESRAIGIFFLVAVGCALGFPLIGYFLMRGHWGNTGRVIAISGALAFLTLALAGGCYVAQLWSREADAQAARPVRANFDFMYMAIATRDVQGLTRPAHDQVKPTVVIPQWERCAIDGAWCDTPRRQAHMLCKGGEVYVDEKDWPAFALIPKENLTGAVPLKSMRLCAAGNAPDY